jgi:hypothetical protein
LLGKPRGLYLSSFKVMNRFLVEQVCRYSGPAPYLDGLVLRATRSIGQLDVEHHPRLNGRSRYTLTKLVGLWMNMSLGCSLLPLRIATIVGMLISIVGSALIGYAIAARLMMSPHPAGDHPFTPALIIMACGVQLFALGIIGEYIGRLFQQQSGVPPYVIRYTNEQEPATASHRLHRQAF